MGGGGIPEGVPGEHPEMSAEALAAGAAEGAQKVRTSAQSRLRKLALQRKFKFMSSCRDAYRDRLDAAER